MRKWEISDVDPKQRRKTEMSDEEFDGACDVCGLVKYYESHGIHHGHGEHFPRGRHTRAVTRWRKRAQSPLVKPTVSAAVRERQVKTLRDASALSEAQASQHNSQHWDDRKAWWAAVQEQHANDGEHKLEPGKMAIARRHAVRRWCRLTPPSG